MNDEPLYPEHPDLAAAQQHLQDGLRKEARAERAAKCAATGHEPGCRLIAWGSAATVMVCARCGTRTFSGEL